MSTAYDVIVIGGGIVGAATAYHLVQAGAKTLLIDRNDGGRATSAGAGIIAPPMSQVSSEAWFNFAVQAGDYYPTLIAQLAQQQAGETGYARCGMLLVAATPDEIAPFAAAKAMILQRQQRRNAPPTDDLYPVSPQAAQERFPALTAVQDALYYHNAARVDGRLITAALLRAATTAQGLTTLAAAVDALWIEQYQIRGVVVKGDKIGAGAAVIAGGAWTQRFAEQLQVKIPVEPQRGQIIHLDLPGVETANWPVVSAFHGHYLVCWPSKNGVGRVVAGATRETGAGFAPHSTAQGIIEVLSEALRVAPGLATAQLYEVRVGLRPLAIDGLPVLCYAPSVKGAVIATGHGPTGLQLGPLSGKIAGDLALGQPVTADIGAFDIRRFE